MHLSGFARRRAGGAAVAIIMSVLLSSVNAGAQEKARTATPDRPPPRRGSVSVLPFGHGLGAYPEPAPRTLSLVPVAYPGSAAVVLETEPNDTPATANAVALGDSTSGVIDPAGDVDVFAIDLTAGELAEFDVDAQALPGGSYLDSYLTLYGPDGITIVAQNDDWDGLDSYLLYAPPADGTYFLEISPCCGPGGGPGGPEYNYLIRIGAFLAELDESEPNDSPAQATVMALGGGLFRGLIDPASDIDYFAIDAPEAGVLLVEWSAFQWWFPAIVKLWDADGTTLLDSVHVEYDWPHRVEAFVPSSGRVYVSVEDAYADPAFGGVRLYGLTSMLQPAGPGDPTTVFATGLGAPRQLVPDWAGNFFALDIDGNRVVRVAGRGSTSVFAAFTDMSALGVTVDGFGDVLVVGYDYAASHAGIWRVASGGARTAFTSDTAGINELWVLSVGPDGDVWTGGCTNQACPALLRFDPLGNLKSTIPVPDYVADIAFSPSGVPHFSNDHDGVFRVTDTGGERVITAGPYLEGIAFDEDGYLYVANGYTGQVALYGPSYAVEHEVFASTNLSGPILLAFMRDASGVMTSRLFAANWGWDEPSLTGTMVEMNPAGMRAPGASVGVQLLQLATTAVRSGLVGADYADTLVLENPPAGQVTWTVLDGGLPPGLTLDASSGRIAGIPTTEGVHPFTVRVTAGERIGFGRFAITIGEPTIAVDDAVDAALGVTGVLTQDLQRFLDIRGNNNGRYDIGDLRAYLQERGVLQSPALQTAAAAGKER
jgi:hypothetical protein